DRLSFVDRLRSRARIPDRASARLGHGRAPLLAARMGFFASRGEHMTRRLALAMLACAGAMRIAAATDFSAHGYLGCRLIARADERSWADGGFGKTRFGGGGFSAGCVQADLTVTAQLTPALLALADVQYQTTDKNAFSALEAYLRYRPVSTTPFRW